MKEDRSQMMMRTLHLKTLMKMKNTKCSSIYMKSIKETLITFPKSKD